MIADHELDDGQEYESENRKVERASTIRRRYALRQSYDDGQDRGEDAELDGGERPAFVRLRKQDRREQRNVETDDHETARQR